jgi:hypothetical protein
VYSKNFGSSYGFEFNPPLEFHAWVNYGDNIIDLALPGVIEMGCILKDKYGPYLDRKPIVLAGEEIPNWIEYTAIRKYNWMEYVTMNNRRIYETQI